MNRGDLVKIALDTIEMCENDYNWMLTKADNIFYSENYFSVEKTIKKFAKSNIKVTQQTTVDAIIDNSDKVYGVLNFASARNPGGGVLKGAMAQEEALARVSSLYPVIKQCTEFYGPVSAPYYTDRIIYSKPIYVFKNDYGIEIEPIECEVITCAAPNYSFDDNYNLQYHKSLMTTRFTKVLKSAIANNQKNLILGAWGCGVFKNPPDVNAQIFRDVLDSYSSSFNEVIFAIPDDRNFQIFKQNLL
jgi:uncharacterized protein (TIGR02452 family)